MARSIRASTSFGALCAAPFRFKRACSGSMRHAPWQHVTCPVAACNMPRGSMQHAACNWHTEYNAIRRTLRRHRSSLDWHYAVPHRGWPAWASRHCSGLERRRRGGAAQERDDIRMGPRRRMAAVCLHVRVRRIQRRVDFSLRHFAQTLFGAPQQLLTCMIDPRIRTCMMRSGMRASVCLLTSACWHARMAAGVCTRGGSRRSRCDCMTALARAAAARSAAAHAPPAACAFRLALPLRPSVPHRCAADGRAAEDRSESG
jgi:hypothetical protein